MGEAPPAPASITLRKAEVQAVAEVLEGDYETSQDAARAALKASWALFQARPWYVITSRDFGLSYGVYATENDAVKKAQKGHELGLGGELFITAIHSASAQEAHVDEVDHDEAGTDPLCVCGHRKTNHDVPGSKYKGACYAPRKICACRKFELPA